MTFFSTQRVRPYLTIALFGLLFLGSLVPAKAIPFIVQNNFDSGPNSLRDAVNQVNANPIFTSIEFASNVSNIVLTSGELQLNRDVSILGRGVTDRVTISGNNNSRILYLANGVDAILKYLNFIQGNGDGIQVYWQTRSGGAILNNRGTLDIEECDFRLNNVIDLGAGWQANAGGAILSWGALTMNRVRFVTNLVQSDASRGGAVTYTGSSSSDIFTFNECQFDKNRSVGTTYGRGGAIYAGGWGSLTVTNSIFTRSYANGGSFTGEGGAIYGLQSSLHLFNSTFSGNHSIGGSSVSGAAIQYKGTSSFSLTNCTLAYNELTGGTGTRGVALHLENTANFSVHNNIMYHNTGNAGNPTDLHVATPNLGFRFAGYNNTIRTQSSGSGTNLFWAFLSTADPLLQGLASNGGFTQTHALECNSPALNTANASFAPSTDQRGEARPDVNTNLPDRGAYEDGNQLGIIAPTIVCRDACVVLEATWPNATGYVWQNLSGGPDPDPQGNGATACIRISQNTIVTLTATDANGCTQTVQVEVKMNEDCAADVSAPCCSGGGDDMQREANQDLSFLEDSKVGIYPNPTQGAFHLAVDSPNGSTLGDVQVRITDLQGRTVITKDYQGQGQHFEADMDLSGNPKGVYFVQITTEVHQWKQMVKVQ